MVEPLFEARTRVARVAVDVGLSHLDYLFDYAIPDHLDAVAQPGVRVRVGFAGQKVDGFIIERSEVARYEGGLAPLVKVVSPEPVLPASMARLLRQVADHYAGLFCDVARIAVPPRHATTESAEQRSWPVPERVGVAEGGLADYPNGRALLEKLACGESPRAFWQVPATSEVDPEALVADAVGAVLASGRGAIVVVPDARAVERARSALAGRFGTGCIAVLHTDLGRAARYRNYLAVLRGEARVLVGTRSAVYAPMPDLGLVVLLDEASDLLAELHAPYPHARDVAAIRASLHGCGLLFASHSRSAEVQAWLERGWLAAVELAPAQARRRVPLVRAAADTDAALERNPLARQIRLPSRAFDTIRTGLTQGPVLVQVPRAGYLVSVSCERCRMSARCVSCHGPVRAIRERAALTLQCGWCGRIQPPFVCQACGFRRLRAPVVGAARTAEELGRAFPGFRLVDSSAERIVDAVSGEPAVVVATPGGEPRAAGGYAAAVLLDSFLLLQRADLRASEEALRRWLNAVALVRPGDRGGTVCVVGPSDDRVIQALVRLDPGGFAARELAERSDAEFPPAWCMGTAEGDRDAVAGLAEALQVPEGVQVLGPVRQPDAGGAERWQLVVRTPARDRAPMVAALKAALGVRSARKMPGTLRLQIDG